ncbi:hypothetical protein KP509_17G063000 [Ceratopteris richardii]|uniref:J domain-containing protein n=1 Tax=Ceratopteris richardii TaxID=49495 RepID=A0A8T2SYC2_CERRI|nr:hypothetical protein KP509_17G063000 [Ceratopteris richardii]
MEQDTPSAPVHQSRPLPSPRPVPSSIAAEPSVPISRPYRLSSDVHHHSAPSALLQRRTHAKQGLSPVDTPHGAHSFDGEPSASREEADEPDEDRSGSADCSERSAYDILGIPTTASQEEIKRSFSRLAILHHPDKAPKDQKETSAAAFTEIYEAYNTLKDPQSRARYDLSLSLKSSSSSSGLADLRKRYYSSPSPTVFTSAPSPRFPTAAPSPRYSTASASPRFSTTATSPGASTTATSRGVASAPPPQPPGVPPSRPRSQQARTPSAAAYTPRTPYPPYTPRQNTGTDAFAFSTPRTPGYSGRSWETDQCW